jgi:DNA-binding XRE family transcriptional regulator
MSERARDVPAAEVDRRARRPVSPTRAATDRTTGLSEKLDLSFAVWLSRQLRRQRISQRELARRGGLDHSTISRILVGARAPSWSTMQRIAQVVGFPPPSVLLGALRTSLAPDVERSARSQSGEEP